jgi:hypothetical protein
MARHHHRGEEGAEATLLLLESLCGQPEQMKRFVGFVPYFQAPFGTVSKACDGVADEVPSTPSHPRAMRRHDLLGRRAHRLNQYLGGFGTHSGASGNFN